MFGSVCNYAAASLVRRVTSSHAGFGSDKGVEDVVLGHGQTAISPVKWTEKYEALGYYTDFYLISTPIVYFPNETIFTCAPYHETLNS